MLTYQLINIIVDISTKGMGDYENRKIDCECQ